MKQYKKQHNQLNKNLLIIFIKVVSLGLLFSISTGCMKNTGSTEVGVRVKKLAVLGGRGIEQKVYSPGSTYFFLPYANDWYTFDTKLQNLEMTLSRDSGDIRGVDDLKFKTIDGNDISLDLIVSYRINPLKAPYILEFVAQNDFELRLKIVRTISRSIPRDIFGELETESFYTAEKRAEKSLKVKGLLNEILEDYGVIIENVLTKDYRFNAAYQQAIEDKKIADQQAEKNKSATKAKEEEYKRKLEEVKGKVNRIVAKADGEFEKFKIEADAIYEQQKNISKAIIAEGKADAKGIKEMNAALAEKGGKIMVKLKIAEALKGKKFVLLPTNSGNGLNLQTIDMNKLLEVKGVQQLNLKNPKLTKH